MNVTSIRIPKELEKAMEYVSKTEKIEKVNSLRKLAQIGFEFYLAKAYESGKLSLREASHYLKLPPSQTLEVFFEMGVRGGIRASDVTASVKSVE